MLLSQLKDKKGVWVRLSMHFRLQADVRAALGDADVAEHLEKFEDSTGIVIGHMTSVPGGRLWPEIIVEWVPWEIPGYRLRYLYDPTDLEIVEL
jgi:hypothetical protein